MSAATATGLGEPQSLGKKSLFQPPEKSSSDVLEVIGQPTPKPADRKKVKKHSSNKISKQPRVRSTVELTAKALTVIHNRQHSHRLKSGRALPLWKAISDIIEEYGQRNGLQ